MKIRKNPQVDIKLHYHRAVELGFCGALFIVILMFYAFRQEITSQIEFDALDLDIEVEEIPPTEQIKRPPPPARPAVAIPSEDEEIPEDETIDITEINFAEIPPPPTACRQ